MPCVPSAPNSSGGRKTPIEPGGTHNGSPPTPTFSSFAASSDCLNMVERIKSLRNTSYRHLTDSHPDTDTEGTTKTSNDFVMSIDDTQAGTVGKSDNASQLGKSLTNLERRSRAASAGARATTGNMGKPEDGLPPRVRFAEASAELEHEPGKEEGIWRECNYDFLGKGSPWDRNPLPAGSVDEKKWRAKSFDISHGAGFRQPPDSSGSLLRRQIKEGVVDMELEDVSLTAMPQWPLKQPLANLTERQMFSHLDTMDMSKDPSDINSSGRISQMGSDSTNSSLSTTALLTRLPSPADHLTNLTENPTYSPATEHGATGAAISIGVFGGEGGRFGRPQSRADKIDRVDELGSLRSRRSSSRSSHRHSFRGEELIVKSPSVPTSHYNRMKSRFSEPAKPSEESGFPESMGTFIPRSGQLRSGPMRSGPMRSGQLKSQQMKSGMIPRTGFLGRVEEEEDDPFKDADLPDRPKFARKWSWWVCLEWTALLLNLAALTCSRTIPQLRDISLLGLLLWKWILLLLVVLCGRLVSGWVVRLLVFLLEWNFLMRKRVLYFVYALRRGVKYCTWLALVLMAWNFMFDSKVATANQKLVYVTKVLQCLLIAAVLFVIKVFLVKVLASCFHVGTYFERIRDSLFSQYVLETLSGPPVVEIEQILDDEQKLMDEVALLKKAGATAPGLAGLGEPMVPRSGILKPQSTLKRSKTLAVGEVKGGSGISVQHLHKMNQKNVSAWNMKRLIKLVKYQGVTTLSQTIDDGVNSEGEGMDTEIRSEWQAKAAAKEIFSNVARPGLTYLDEDDLMRFMQEEEAIRALALFDGAMESGKITKQALKSWVVNVYQERRALALSLSDTKTAVNKLHRILDAILFVLVVIIWLLVLGVATSQLLVFVSSQLLLIVFIFGNTLKTVFEAIVFLFVMHPYDIGDRCVIDGVQYVVEEMNILTTVFLGDANAKVWFPNSVLATKPIQNFYRSPDMGDSFDFIVSASTPAEKIGLLKERIGKYITSKSHHWKATFGLNVSDLAAEGGRLKLSLGLSHTMNHQNFGEKVARRSELMWELKRLFEELGIEYHLPPQEVHVKTLPGSTMNVAQPPG